jgi:hypothetical protein
MGSSFGLMGRERSLLPAPKQEEDQSYFIEMIHVNEGIRGFSCPTWDSFGPQIKTLTIPA